MESVLTQPCLRAHDHAVLATEWRDGRLHMSPVTVGLDAAGRAISSSRATAATVHHLPCDPRAAFCVFVEACTGPWVQIEGTAEVVPFPEAMAPLVEEYRRLADARRSEPSGRRGREARGLVTAAILRWRFSSLPSSPWSRRRGMRASVV